MAKERPEWLTKSTVYDPNASTLDAATGDDELMTEPHQTKHHRKDDTGTLYTSNVNVQQCTVEREISRGLDFMD